MNIFSSGLTRNARRPFGRAKASRIFTSFIGDHDPLEMMEPNFDHPAIAKLQRKTLMRLLGAQPERCSGPADSGE